MVSAARLVSTAIRRETSFDGGGGGIFRGGEEIAGEHSDDAGAFFIGELLEGRGAFDALFIGLGELRARQESRKPRRRRPSG